MKGIGTALLDDDDRASRGMAILGRRNGCDYLHLIDGVENRIGCIRAAWLRAIHGVLEVADVGGGAPVDRKAAKRPCVRQTTYLHSRRKVQYRARAALEQRHALKEIASDD